MLELIRNRLVWAEQADSGSPIVLRSLTEVPAEEAVREAILSVRNAQQSAGQNELPEEQNLLEKPEAISPVSGELEEEEEDLDIELPDIELSGERPRIPIQEIQPPSAKPNPSPATPSNRDDSEQILDFPASS